MKKIQIGTAHAYDVSIESGCIKTIGAFLAPYAKNGYAAIITDSVVDALYGETVTRSLSENGVRAVKFVFPNGEKSKNADTYLRALSFLAENHVTRDDLIIALGGGVVGDLAGFTAATFLRGVDFVQIPTTLLAMVDSSVGGKTAIDLPAGKNLVGAFHQPRAVFCDPEVLETLSADIFRDGAAEVIKYGVLGDAELFAHLSEKGPLFDRDYVLGRCIALKSRIVAEDEFDKGERQKLNLGHTVGHAIEKESHYALSHGLCVGIGMAMVAKSAAANGFCDKKVFEEICAVLEKFGLPKDAEMEKERILSAMLSDKKRHGDTITLVLPEKIGKAVLHDLPISSLSAFLFEGDKEEV